MMSKLYKKHVFVCVNQRDHSQKKSCGQIGAQIRSNLKQEIVKRNLNQEIRINKSGCLGKCSQGPCLVIYPNQEWKFNLDTEDCKEIINKLITE